MVIMVTGALGQLGQMIQSVASYSNDKFVFLSSSDLNITSENDVIKTIADVRPNFVINAAAYTAVDAAESNIAKAFEINRDGVKNLANACKTYNCTLIHISTDFVFDGTAEKPYSEFDSPNPINVYGQSKLYGERAIQDIMTNYFIIRTSWLYSSTGHNFFKTILRLAENRSEIRVVDDQIGSPTNARDLSEAILHIIKSDSKMFGLYHFSNAGECSWFEFAQQIVKNHQLPVNIVPINSIEYPTAATRPKFSVLDKKKFSQSFRYEIRGWKEALLDL